ncbi:Protein F47B7.1 [Aphelenchoides avenae]|nr:Protein F47B7.1 [Aphelenchus avenae]
MSESQTKKVCELILAIFLPPVAVFLHAGCDMHFFLNILLLCFVFLPAVIHAIWFCFIRDSP